MAFWKKLRFRKRRRNVAVTYPDIATMTENLTSETGIQVSSIEMNHKSDAGTQVDSKHTCEAYTQTHDALTTRDIATMTTQFSSIEMNVRCDAGTHVDSNVTCDTSTQTPKGNEQPKNITGGDAAENEKEQIKRNFSEIYKFFEEKDCQIRKLNATIHEMKVRQRSQIQYVKTKEEMKKSSLLHKISGMRKILLA